MSNIVVAASPTNNELSASSRSIWSPGILDKDFWFCDVTRRRLITDNPSVRRVIYEQKSAGFESPIGSVGDHVVGRRQSISITDTNVNTLVKIDLLRATKLRALSIHNMSKIERKMSSSQMNNLVVK